MPPRRTSSGRQAGSRPLEQTLPPGTRFVRLLWTDLAGLRRARVLPASRWAAAAHLGTTTGPPQVALAEACLALTTLSDAPAWPPEMLHQPGPALLLPGLGARAVPLAACPGHAMVACDIRAAPSGFRDGEALNSCPRMNLRTKLEELESDLAFAVGFEVEFRLLARGGGGGGPGGRTAAAPAATGPPNYALASTVDAAAPILDAIADGLAAAGIELQQYHGESGTGAFEVVTAPLRDPVAAVDNLLYTRQIIASVANAAGYDVTFAPKPVPGQAGLGAHVHLSVWPGGSERAPTDSDCFLYNDDDGADDGARGPTSSAGRAFIAGILNRLDGLLAVTAGSPASFERSQPGAWAGSHQRWAVEDKEAPLRYIPSGCGRLEVKCLDATANPYLALAALLVAGVKGIRNCEILDPPAGPLAARYDQDHGNPAVDRPLPGARLPTSVEAALAACERDEVQDALEEGIWEDLLRVLRAVRRADAAEAARVVAESGEEALRAAYNRVYS